MQRDFKGVWIPKDIWLAENISWIEKLVLTELDSLDNDDGCFATNEYIGNFFNLSKDRISRIVSKLAKENYISVSFIYKPNSKQIEKRVIKILPRGIGENTNRYRQEHQGGIGENTEGYRRKHREGIGENTKDNNTINNTINNTFNINIYSQVVDYLNKKVGTSYKSTSKKTRTLIKARFDDGFTLDDFIKVIDNKTKEWLSTDMQVYLRPETLFGTKFEGYLNQKVKNNSYDPMKFNNFEARDYDYNDLEKKLLGWE